MNQIGQNGNQMWSRLSRIQYGSNVNQHMQHASQSGSHVIQIGPNVWCVCIQNVWLQIGSWIAGLMRLWRGCPKYRDVLIHNRLSFLQLAFSYVSHTPYLRSFPVSTVYTRGVMLSCRSVPAGPQGIDSPLMFQSWWPRYGGISSPIIPPRKCAIQKRSSCKMCPQMCTSKVNQTSKYDLHLCTRLGSAHFKRFTFGKQVHISGAHFGFTFWVHICS